MAADTVADKARFLSAGDGGVVVEFGDTVDRTISARVMKTAEMIRDAALDGVTELVPTFRSLFVHYDPTITSASTITDIIAAMPLDDVEASAMRHVWRIPVLYGGEGGPDLADVAATAGMSEADAVALHAGSVYNVYMLGFLPGFGYLGDTPEPLRLPRLETPRVRVPAGSVALTGQMTAVYPLESPGGWRLLGKTPVRFFDIAAERPALLAPGDGVRFVPVDDAAYDDIAALCREGRYEVEREDAA
ncbi:5-oxoprolinase subunit PxpB [Acuticoccus mangrovi]|uniref:5-oxoprolinase subunit PxpB n=1 Tax=Acuticoccus mangrovi TaxID=2796142 RepID=A0A934MGI6_9HYPH|nr:5-oxoprolinase subunit PxpB [Acuticoccus mangrovi]MBJ3776623.1 5-oxoprolinase subunit PxpB [Acuticoccus mangrovi]